ncbi:MAG: phage major capsid protein [Hyphomicrobiaceae bacterium]|nr:MAG: phage major capsid protein [Hyphomicrobiaceae bacterium]
MTKLQQLLMKLKEERDAQKADFAPYVEDFSKMPAEVKERVAKRDVEIQRIETEAKELEDLEAKAAANDAGMKRFQHATPTDATGGGGESKSFKMIEEEKRILKLARFKSVENFKGERGPVAAYRFAKFFAATVLKSAYASKGIYDVPVCVEAEKYCKEFGLEIKAHSESNNALGGFLVPAEFGNEIVDLREMYGVFRKYAKIIPMGSDTKSWPRRTGGLTVYNPAEATAITESTKGWDSISLTARKFACLALYSSELDEDSMINIGDDLAGEIAYAFANKEDECGFNGDGTSTYFGITGARTAFTNLSGTIANIAGLVVGSGNAYSELTLPDFNKVVGQLPAYADTPRAAWFVHKTFYHTVMEKLALASGGVPAAEVVNGLRQFRFLGYPVVISQVMPKTEANSQVCALLGDLSLAAAFGDRRQLALAYSADIKFVEDQLAIRGTQRVDINVHDVGNASATATSRVAGPLVGLITAAS